MPLLPPPRRRRGRRRDGDGDDRRRSRPVAAATAAALALIGTLLLYGANETLTRDYAPGKGPEKRRTAARRQQRRRAEGGADDGSTVDSSSSVEKKKPNILLFILDQWRYDWDGQSDHVAPNGPVPLRLPFLSSAVANGTRFTEAYVPSPLCAPSRACLASGKEYDFAGMPTNRADRYPTNQTTFYRLLRDGGGYHVMSCGKDDLFKHDVNFPYYPEGGDRRLVMEYLDEVGHGDDDEWDWEPPEEGGGAGGGRKENEPRELNPLNPGWGTMDLGFSDAIRSAGKTKVVRQFEPYEPYRTYLEGRSVALDNGTEVKAFDAYKACWDASQTGSPGPECDSSSFTSEIYPDDFVRNSALTLLGRKPADVPWFLQMNFPGPHPPILATASMAEGVKGREGDGGGWPQPVDALAHEGTCPQDTDGRSGPRVGGRCNYGAQIENLDSLMSSVVDRLAADGELDGTLVCVTGDHGEMLGDHGQWGKAKPWTSSVSVPLVCFGPGVGRGAVHGLPVATLDLAGTFLDYAGVEDRAEGMTTQSLRGLLEDDDATEATTSAVEEAAETATEAVSRLEGTAAAATPTSGAGAGAASNSPPASYRHYVSSGLADWRMVVKSMNGASWKMVCCRGPCDGNPSTATPLVEGEWHMLLFSTKEDPFDLTNVAEAHPYVLDALRGLLPEGWCPKA